MDDRVRKFIDQTGLSRATYFNIKRELKNNDQLPTSMRIDVPRRTLRGTPPQEADAENGDRDVDSQVHGDPGTRRQPGAHASPPSCEYSDNPNDYADYADYLADWWKRPQPTESLDANDGLAERRARENDGWLYREMRQAIEREDYERAAQLRDEIQRLEDGNQQDIE